GSAGGVRASGGGDGHGGLRHDPPGILMPASDVLAADQLRVRMYRVGFGDCFLLSLPVDGGHRHVLVDCGVHPSGDIRTIQRVVENLGEATQGALALLVATHEHADHISGFGAFADAFGRLRIGEIWMPWAMNLDDPEAVELRKSRLAVATALN